MTATLSDGSTVHADLVVGADGAHSAVRRLAFGPEDDFVTPLGGYHAWFTAPDHVGLDGWYLLYQEPGWWRRCGPTIHPNRRRRAWPFAQSRSPTTGMTWTPSCAILDERFAGAKWESAALLAAAHTADDFYFDSFVQVHMDSWSSGRATLVGDAAYCASPLSGIGTALALVGAYVLAGELGAAADLSPENLRRALARLRDEAAAVRRPMRRTYPRASTVSRQTPTRTS